MFIRGLSLGLSLAIASVAHAGAVVTLSVCNQTGVGERCEDQAAGPPFFPGDTVLIDVSLTQDGGSIDHLLRQVQFDLNAPSNTLLDSITLPVQHNLDGVSAPTADDIDFWSFRSISACSTTEMVCGRDHFIVDGGREAEGDPPVPPGSGIISITFGSEDELGADVIDQLLLPGNAITGLELGLNSLHVGTLAAKIPVSVPAFPTQFLVDVLNTAETDVHKGAQVRFGFGGGDPITVWRGIPGGELTGGQIFLPVEEPQIELEIAKIVDPLSSLTPEEGDTVGFEVTLTNNSSTNATGVVVEERIPAGLTFVAASASSSAGVPIFTFNPGTGQWEWDVGNLAGPGFVTLNFDTTVDVGTGGDTLTNTAEVIAADQADSDPTNDQDSASVTVMPTALPVDVVRWDSEVGHLSVGGAPDFLPLIVPLVIPARNAGTNTPSFSEPRFMGRLGSKTRFRVVLDGPVDPATAIPGNVTVLRTDSAGVVTDLSATVSDVLLENGDSELLIEIVPLLPDLSIYTITLTGMTNTAGAALGGDTSRCLATLLGDVSGDRAVFGNDVGGTIGLLRTLDDALINTGIPIQVRGDVNADGFIFGNDLSAIIGRIENVTPAFTCP